MVFAPFQLILTIALFHLTCPAPQGVFEEMGNYYDNDDDRMAEALNGGPIEPSKNIKSFVEKVFRGGADPNFDSGEDLRPTFENATDEIKANVGFEQYWPGGQWVYAKAVLEHCNTTDAECNPVYKAYGEICASNDKVDAHETFSNMCEMMDANCRDGTITTWTSSHLNVDYKFYPVTRDKIRLKIATRQECFIVLTESKYVDAYTPIYCIFFATDTQANKVELREFSNNDMPVFASLNYYDLESIFLWDEKPKDFELEWNKEEGRIIFSYIKPNGVRGQGFNYADKWRRFHWRYVGILGGSTEKPAYWEIRGWLTAYRGECKPDLFTIPTKNPNDLKERLDIDMYNFAERLDEFGFNFTRHGTTLK